MESAELLGAFTAMLTLVAGGLGFYVKMQVSALLRDNADIHRQINNLFLNCVRRSEFNALFNEFRLVKERQAVVLAQMADLRSAGESRWRHCIPIERDGSP